MMFLVFDNALLRNLFNFSKPAPVCVFPVRLVNRFIQLLKVLPHVAMKTNKKTFKGHHETISFIARPSTQKRRDTSSAKRWKEHNVIALLLNQLQLLFLETKKTQQIYYCTKEIYCFNNK